MKRTVFHNVINKLHGTTTKVLCFVCAVVLLCVAAGCDPNKEEMNDIERAESMLRNNPEEALAIMESIDRSTIFENRELAYYALVYSEACYYNRKLISSDSLTSISVDYYDNRKDYDRRARAFFQHGMVLNLSKQYPEAIIALTESL